MNAKVEDILKKYHQEHIIQYQSLLSPEEQKILEDQILKINFEELQQLYQNAKKEPYIEEKKIEHINYTDKSKLSKERINELEQKGKKVIRDGHYAVVTMAGGQGTRLGHIGPKGSYALNTINGKKYLFEIIVDTLKKAQKEYGITLMWYIMTSKENNNQTVNFLEEHNYFGYDKTKVKFFIQGEMPLLDTKGHIIIDKNKQIKEAADGNGSIYRAMANCGILKNMKANQIDWLFVSNVDNVLSNFVDPLLLALTIEENQKIAAKSVAKTNPKERVGVFCKLNGKAKVIEYIDLPQEMAEEKDENGELRYGEVNIANYLFKRSVLEELVDVKLPYHVALKKSGYLNTNGIYEEPKDPNVYKFETFIFDVFEKYDNITILRVKREEEFAPVKNYEGVDSPQTATALYNKRKELD